MVIESINRTNPSDPSIYEKTQVSDLWILSDPENPNIPSNFELIYQSEKSEVYNEKTDELQGGSFTVYKINHDD